MKPVAFHCTLKTFSFGYANDADSLSRFEQFNCNLLPYFHSLQVINGELSEIAKQPIFAQMPFSGFVEPFCISISQLHCFIAVVVDRFYLGDGAWASLDYSNRNNSAVLEKNLAHPDLLTQQSLYHHSLIEISTPAGKFSLVSESIVFEVGSRISINRLCVLISKCSLESLST